MCIPYIIGSFTEDITEIPKLAIFAIYYICVTFAQLYVTLRKTAIFETISLPFG